MATTLHTGIAARLQSFALRELFIEELGWDRLRETFEVDVDRATYAIDGVAQKRGVRVLQCSPDANGAIPDDAMRKKIEEAVAKQAREHLLIFVDAAKTRQLWLWAKRQPGKSPRYRSEQFLRGQSGERLSQKLQQIAIPIEGEEDLTLVDVTTKVERGFDVDRVTKGFYDRFQKEHGLFVAAISGIADDELRRWYASLMLNRLMFTYFIQRKRFLDDDINYLANRLQRVQALRGPDQFQSFYRSFLLHLFHQGLGRPEADRTFDAQLAALIGRVPYLNGGLFEMHQIERGNRDIDIPDAAFERIFRFFDDYDWHLDDRPLRSDREINPDVLGYIFEKYINQKQMGAYYTKEDITGYIGRNTILPYLFDTARKECGIAFAPDGEVWRLLSDDPDRYIYDAVRKGVDLELPPAIAAGLSDVSKRGGWNKPAADGFALPTETWREHVARRTRCHELRAKLAAGEVTQANDLITYNLDIERFARDVIERCEGPELLDAFWKAISSITVLDPTCGSGAFLFAALNILRPLYEACLDRMEAFVAEFEQKQRKPRGAQNLQRELERVRAHRNKPYFILKSIIVNNLYGVDIMEEACEIAKLRLFLKLVAQVEDAGQLEPLPDIDFNIRAGNTLVGFTSLKAVQDALTLDATGRNRKLLLDTEDEAALARIKQRAANAGEAYRLFKQHQTAEGTTGTLAAAKDDLRRQLEALRAELDRYLAREYRVDPNDLFAYGPWRNSHKPFHWLIEFYAIMDQGGFDVVIGNPPYVVYPQASIGYKIRTSEYETLEAKNLYAYVFERSGQIARKIAPLGLIVQLTAVSSERARVLQNLLIARGRLLALPFPRRPESIFDGVEMPVVILASYPSADSTFITSQVNRFYSDERGHALVCETLLSPA